MRFNRLIYIIISLILIVGGVSLLLITINNREQTNNILSVAQPKVQVISYQQYQKQLLDILTRYPLNVFKSKVGAQAMREEVLAMVSLPAEAQPTQLLLVLAADKIIEDKILESNVILEELGKKYDWLEWWVKL